MDNKNSTNMENNVVNAFIMMFFLLSVWMVILDITYPTKVGSEKVSLNLADSTIQTVEKDTVFRCSTFTPIYDKNGDKKYEVRFKDIHSNFMFTAIVDDSEIDEKHNIEKDAKYEGTITYLYIDKAFDNILSTVEEENRESRILDIISSQSELAKYSEISKVDFMYSDGIQGIDEKSAREKLEGIILEYKKASNEKVLKGIGK